MSKLKSQQQTYFDVISKREDSAAIKFLGRKIEDVYRLFYLELIRTLLPKKKCEVLIDVGCGCGPLFNILGHICNYYVACDISSHSLKVLNKKNKNILAITCDGEFLPLRSSIADFVFASHYIEHTVNQSKALLEIERICKSKAKILIITPNRHGLPELVLTMMRHYGLLERLRVGHINLLTPKDLENKIRKIKTLRVVKRSCSGIFHRGGLSIPRVGLFLSPAYLISLISVYNANMSLIFLKFEQRIAQAHASIAHDIIMLLEKL
jgi:ubiquinone/menaquinone biosynthesis C-methylase UbiE